MCRAETDVASIDVHRYSYNVGLGSGRSRESVLWSADPNTEYAATCSCVHVFGRWTSRGLSTVVHIMLPLEPPELAASDGFAFDEAGSGAEICSALISQSACPSQCVWCEEAQLCVTTWRECELPAGNGGFALLVFFGLGVCAAAIISRYRSWHSLRELLAPPTANHEPRAYESYELQDEDPIVHAAPAVSGANERTPEGQRLLRGEV